MAEEQHNETHHEHGHMDVSDHEKTFLAFVKAGMYVVMGVAVILIILALLTF